MRYIGVVGTRQANAWSQAYCAYLVKTLITNDPETIIVTGGDDEHHVGGDIDCCASRIAREMQTEPIVHLPQTHPEGHPQAGRWTHLGAGVARNTLIVQDAVDGVYAFWNGISKGSLDSIKKAMDAERLNQIIFDNGTIWKIGNTWNPFVYGGTMPDQFDLEHLTMAMFIRLKANKQSRLCHIGNTLTHPIDPDRLDYANGRTLHAFQLLIDGVRPSRGFGEDAGCWFVPSENKRKPDVRPHRIGTDGWCDCDAVTKGRHWDDEGHGNPCYAMYLVFMYQRLISPTLISMRELGDELTAALQKVREEA